MTDRKWLPTVLALWAVTLVVAVAVLLVARGGGTPPPPTVASSVASTGTAPPATTRPLATTTTLDLSGSAGARILTGAPVDWSLDDLASLTAREAETIYVALTRSALPGGWRHLDDMEILEFGHSWCAILDDFRGDAARALSGIIDEVVNLEPDNPGPTIDAVIASTVYGTVLCPEWHTVAIRSVEEAAGGGA